MASILIKNADWLVTMDRDRRIIRDGAVAIEGSTISSVGKTSEVERACKAQTVIDARDKLVLPGLIEGHVHNTQILPRGLADECDPGEWLRRVPGTFEPAMTPEDAYWAVMLCQLEMLKAGTTCFIDIGNDFPDETAQAVGQSGLRGIIALGVYDLGETGLMKIPAGWMQSADKAMERAEKVVKRWHGSLEGRLRASFSLRVHQNSSDELCRGLKALADRYRVLLQSHVAYSLGSVEASKRRWGHRDVERFDKLGLLGLNFLAAHNGWLNFREIKLYKEHDVKVAHCPGASLHGTYGAMAHGLFPEMVEMGITVCLGSDSGAAGNFMDVVRSMYLAAGCFKDRRLDPSIMPAETVLEMAIINGARAALWEDEIGSLEEGKRADITIFNMNRPEWRPVYNPINTLVYSATGASADTVIVDGRVLMQGREVRTLDEEEILRKAQEAGLRVLERADMKQYAMPRWPVM